MPTSKIIHNRMQLTHVVPHIDKEAAGPSYSVPMLCQSLAEAGDEVTLLCLAARGPIPGVDLQCLPQWQSMQRFAVSPPMARAIAERARSADIVHNHSLWSMSNVATGWAVPGKRARLVTSPRGTLSPVALQRSKVVKRFMWPFQQRALSRADLLHATSDEEYRQIREQGFKAPIAVIPNGIDLPELEAHPLPEDHRTLLYMGRIHPIKGLDRLIVSWSRIQNEFPEWRLEIAGVGDAAYVAELRELTKREGANRVTFPGPVYGDDKRMAYLNADATVLPTHSENFGMVVAEALALGRPALVSKGAPWEALKTYHCGWWVDNDIESLTAALHDVLNTSREQMMVMGTRGRRLMEEQFDWRSVAQRMHHAYQWIVQGGECPPCVITS